MGRRTKVDLHSVLVLVHRLEPSYRELVEEIARRESCSARTAQDAVTVLRRAGYLVSEPAGRDRSRPYDLDRTIYRLTSRGLDVVRHPLGRHVLRGARRLFTTAGSRRQRRRQRAIAANTGLDRELARLEANYLEPDGPPTSRTEEPQAGTGSAD